MRLSKFSQIAEPIWQARERGRAAFGSAQGARPLQANRIVKALGRGPTGPPIALFLALEPASALSWLSLAMSAEPRLAHLLLRGNE